MTQKEEQLICYYQRKGNGYKKTAQLTGIPEGTVKTYYRRFLADSVGSTCLTCGSHIVQAQHRKQKLFCSDACRMMWWNAHPEMVRRIRDKHTCLCCGKTYLTHIAGQKYCSRACYADSRRKAAQADD